MQEIQENSISKDLQEDLPNPSDPNDEDQDLSVFEQRVPRLLERAVQDKAEDLIFVSKVTGTIAEWAKEEPARRVFKEIKCMHLLIQILASVAAQKQSDIQKHAFINTLRALANLCFDFDENRDDILACSGGIETIVAATIYPDSKIILTAYKAILNISMDNELVQSAMVCAGLAGHIVAALHVIQPDRVLPPTGIKRDIVVAAIKVWSSVLESDAGLDELVKGPGGIKCIDQCVSRMMQVVTASDEVCDYEWALEVMDAMSIVLETISENDKAQKLIVQSDILTTTMDFIEAEPFPRPGKGDSADKDALDTIKLLLAKVVTSTTMSDGNMRYLIDKKDIISRFLAWTSVAGGGRDLNDEIRMTGALCLGNIGRSDETCVILVKTHHIQVALLQMVEAEYQAMTAARYNKEETKNVIKVIHAVLGALKNLSLAAEIRPALGEAKTIESIIRLFEIEHIQPLFISIVGIIKNLCTGTVERIDCNIYRVMTSLEPPPNAKTLDSMPFPDDVSTSTTYLSRMINVVWNTAKEGEGAGVRNEGGRLLVQIVKSIYRSSARQYLSVLFELNAITLILQILTGAHLTTPTTNVSLSRAQFDAPSESTRVFPLVQNESIVALSLLCSMDASSIGEIYKFRSVVPTLLCILSGGDMEESVPTYSIETKMNAVLLLRHLVSLNGFVEKKEVGEVLRRLVDLSVGESPGVEYQFQIAISHVLRSLSV